MVRPERRPLLLLVAAVIFGLAAIHPVLVIATGQTYGEVPRGYGVGFAAVSALLYGAAALGLLVRNRSPRPSWIAFELPWVSLLWLLWHGSSAHLLGDPSGIPYILATFVVAVLLKQGFSPLVRTTGPGEHLARPGVRWQVTASGLEHPVI